MGTFPAACELEWRTSRRSKSGGLEADSHTEDILGGDHGAVGGLLAARNSPTNRCDGMHEHDDSAFAAPVIAISVGALTLSKSRVKGDVRLDFSGFVALTG